MLTEAQLELLTAAVDGVLPAPQEAALRRLVAHSDEAKATFRHLLQNQRRLKAARRHAAPASLSKSVMARIPAGTVPFVAPAKPARTAGGFLPHLSWRPYAVAASLFFAVVMGSFWFNAVYGDYNTVSAQQKSLPRPAVDPEGRETAVVVAIALDRRPEVLPAPRPPYRPNPNDFAQLPPSPKPTPELIVAPRPHTYDVIGSRDMITELKPRDLVPVRLPVLGPVGDLDRADAQAQLAQEMARDSAFRLDLFAKDTTKGLESVVAAAKTLGLTVHQDGASDDRLKRKPTWVFYTESLTAEEIGKFAAELAAQEKAPDRQPAFAWFHFVPAQQAEQRELRDLLGVDPGLWKKPLKAGANAAPKSATGGTLPEVMTTLIKGPLPKPTGNQAIVLPSLPLAARVPPSSSKVKAFLDQRGDRKVGAVPLIVVVKPLPG
jgi:hypothetical protein